MKNISGIKGSGSERFNAVKIFYVQITALSNESQRETSSTMKRNIGRTYIYIYIYIERERERERERETTEAANAIKSAPVLLTENSMAHIRTSHSGMNEALCNRTFVYSHVRIYDSTLSI